MDISTVPWSPVATGGDAPMLAALLARLHRATRKRVREEMPDPALPQSQVEVLRLLHRQPGARVQDVAAMLGLAPNTASTLVQHLVRAGYVERRGDPDDRRVAHLELTDGARARMERWRDRRAAVLARALDALPPPERDRLRDALPALAQLAALLEDRVP